MGTEIVNSFFLFLSLFALTSCEKPSVATQPAQCRTVWAQPYLVEPVDNIAACRSPGDIVISMHYKSESDSRFVDRIECAKLQTHCEVP